MRFVKALRFHLFLLVISLIASVLTIMFVNVQPRIISAIASVFWIIGIVCLFCLSCGNKRYRTAAVLNILSRVVSVVYSTVYYALLSRDVAVGENISTIISTIFSIIISYQLYTAHAEVVAEYDYNLSNKWRKLFGLSFIITVLSMLSTFMVNSSLSIAIWLSRYILNGTVLNIIGILLSLVTIVYVKRMISLFSANEE